MLAALREKRSHSCLTQLEGPGDFDLRHKSRASSIVHSPSADAGGGFIFKRNDSRYDDGGITVVATGRTQFPVDLFISHLTDVKRRSPQVGGSIASDGTDATSIIIGRPIRRGQTAGSANWIDFPLARVRGSSTCAHLHVHLRRLPGEKALARKERDLEERFAKSIQKLLAFGDWERPMVSVAGFQKPRVQTRKGKAPNGATKQITWCQNRN